MSRLRKDAQKGAAKNRGPHAKSLKTGRTQNATDRRQSTSAREDSQRNGSSAWTSEFNAPRTVMLRAMNFVMTPPAVSAPMSKRMRSRSSRPSNRVSASPGERATKPTWEVRARGAEQPAKNSNTKIRDPNPSLGTFAQVNLISVAPTLQNLRIGLKRRQSGKSDVPAKQRGGWPKVC